jgi:hypothetical protein
MTTHVHLTQITEAAALCRKALKTVQRHIIARRPCWKPFSRRSPRTDISCWRMFPE